MPDWLPQLLTFLAAIVTAGVTAWATVTVARRQTKVAVKAADAEVQKSINDGFEKLTVQLHAEIERMQRALASAEAEMEDLRGWIRELIQHIESLERILQSNGLDVPSRQSSARILPGGKVQRA